MHCILQKSDKSSKLSYPFTMIHDTEGQDTKYSVKKYFELHFNENHLVFYRP